MAAVELSVGYTVEASKALKKKLDPVGCQLRSWVGREFI